jgi:hypothetical protein
MFIVAKPAGVLNTFDSSEEIVGRFRLGELAKRVIEGEFEDVVGAKAIGFSHGEFGFVIQSFNDTAGKQFLSAEVVEDELAMVA